MKLPKNQTASQWSHSLILWFILNLQIQEERERRHRDSDMLEAHIMQAQAAAMAADEKELQKKSEGYENYHSLGLPPGKL